MNEPPLLLDPALNRLPEHVSRIHLIGVGGTAMAALAGMLVQHGFQVSGSDNTLYPPMSSLIERLGLPPTNGYRAEHLAHRPDLVIVGNVVSRDNPEAQALAAAGLPYLSMPQAIARLFLQGKRSLVVAGTHGKTTTASLLASALAGAGSDPSFLIGGIVKEFNANYRLGDGPFFVIEGDEYDTAFFDKHSKFLHYRPEIAIITSVEFDHADIFDNIDAIKASFQRFVTLLPPHGLLVANLDDPLVAEVVADAPCPVQGYGRGAGHCWQLSSIEPQREQTTFTLMHHGAPFGRFSIRQPGLHNCLNATAVIAVLHQLGYHRDEIGAGLTAFRGVKRRQEIRGVIDDITVIDDFAHHPTAVRETLQALTSAYPGQRLIVAFEPRSNTSRRSLFQQQYATAFDAADRVFIKEPPLLKQTDHLDRLSAPDLADDLGKRGIEAYACVDSDAIITKLVPAARPGDIIAVLSNGGFDNIHERILAALTDARHAGRTDE